jgi:hypothetical protein
MVKVDVNNSETQMSVMEASVSDLDICEMVDNHNPDCFVIIYAVDDMESFGKFSQIIENYRFDLNLKIYEPLFKLGVVKFIILKGLMGPRSSSVEFKNKLWLF